LVAASKSTFSTNKLGAKHQQVTGTVLDVAEFVDRMQCARAACIRSVSRVPHVSTDKTFLSIFTPDGHRQRRRWQSVPGVSVSVISSTQFSSVLPVLQAAGASRAVELTTRH